MEHAPRATASTGVLAELYERHAPAAGRLAYLLTGDRSEAEDLVQEAFVRVVDRLRHLRVPDAFCVYLRRTIVNLHTSQLRRRRLERAHLEREGRAPDVEVGMPDVGARADLCMRCLPSHHGNARRSSFATTKTSPNGKRPRCSGAPAALRCRPPRSRERPYCIAVEAPDSPNSSLNYRYGPLFAESYDDYRGGWIET